MGRGDDSGQGEIVRLNGHRINDLFIERNTDPGNSGTESCLEPVVKSLAPPESAALGIESESWQNQKIDLFGVDKKCRVATEHFLWFLNVEGPRCEAFGNDFGD